MAVADHSPEETLAGFVAAFSRLDLDAMMDYWAAGATAFAPIEHAQERLDGRDAIRVMFAGVLTRVRATGATELPLYPEGLQTQSFGDLAIVTLHFRGAHLSRRTFVLHYTGGYWQIVHLHGSNGVPLPLGGQRDEGLRTWGSRE